MTYTKEGFLFCFAKGHKGILKDIQTVNLQFELYVDPFQSLGKPCLKLPNVGNVGQSVGHLYHIGYLTDCPEFLDKCSWRSKDEPQGLW